MQLESDLSYRQHKLSNGIRLVHRSTYSPVAHCAITINVGSRDEQPQEYGLAHFIEHSIFKGTEKRRSLHILNRIDGVGGELNAFTTKEETCIYASFLNKYHDRVLELFSDILFNSIFPQKEIDKEKIVVIDEINSYEDNPSELIFDDFERLVFRQHGLGRYILGTPKQVLNFSTDQIKSFVKRTYSTNSIVISTIGAIDFDQWVGKCEKYFGSIKEDNKKINRTPFKNYKPIKKIIPRDTYQSHVVLGNIAFSYKNKRKLAFSLLNNIIGGPAMNSRLNIKIREKYGFTYSLESNYTAYSDVGLFTVYAATDEKYIDKTINLIEKELEYYCNNKIKPLNLNQAKQQLIGQLAIQYENNQNEVLSMGKSILNYNKIDTLLTTNQEIEKITAEEIQEVAQKVFQKNKYSQIKYIH
ncbi:MAG: pitrilysin family protein [Bacteroidales bacterium]|nr:pitrilysin family protein [Bacteroidales bacterium]MDD4829482.1 pitrilysin family protein [Bacteroidales bacterium]